MFRRLPQSLPKDPVFPQDLEKLGYFIDSNDEVKSIEHPDEYFQFFITDNERFNESQREAFHGCIRNDIINRMIDLGVPPLYLPNLTPIKPSQSSPHLAILATPAARLRQARRIFLFIGEASQDLGVLSYRIIGRRGGIAAGSVVRVVEELLRRQHVRSNKDSDETPGIIILNPGQLLYSHTQGTAMTQTTWSALPRVSAAHPPPRVNKLHNRIHGNTSAAEHISFVMENVVRNPAFVGPHAELYIVAVGTGADDVLNYLEETWPTTQHTPHARIAALALADPRPIHASTAPAPLHPSSSFPAFLGARSRAYVTSKYARGTPLANATRTSELPARLRPSSTMTTAADDGSAVTITIPVPEPADVDAGTETMDMRALLHAHRQIYCQPHVASGEDMYRECVLPAAYMTVLDWFEEVAAGGGGAGGYENPEMEIPREVLEDAKREMEIALEESGWAKEEVVVAEEGKLEDAGGKAIEG